MCIVMPLITSRLNLETWKRRNELDHTVYFPKLQAPKKLLTTFPSCILVVSPNLPYRECKGLKIWNLNPIIYIHIIHIFYAYLIIINHTFIPFKHQPPWSNSQLHNLEIIIQNRRIPVFLIVKSTSKSKWNTRIHHIITSIMILVKCQNCNSKK